MGAPSKFDSIDKEYWLYLAEKGFTNREIALKLGVDERTLYNWHKKYPNLFQTLKDEKNIADSKVEASLYERARGYSVKEVKLFQDKNGEIVEHEIIKHYPPDPTSMIFWLKNRQPNKWRDKQEIEQTQEIKVNIDKEDTLV